MAYRLAPKLCHTDLLRYFCGLSTAHTTQDIEIVYRRDARSVIATLVRLLGDFDLAEVALHEGFRAALE